MKKTAVSASILAVNLFAGWGTPPADWGDFKFGMTDAGRSPFQENLASAVKAGIPIDYRYTYITTVEDVSPSISPSNGFLLAPGWGWLAKTPAGIRPSITIYFIQQGQDAPDGSSASNSCKDAAYMKKYFKACAEIADSCAGMKPIYVIEPDVWGYLLERNQPAMSTKKLSQVCHINDLGLPWLSDTSEFKNTIEYLPKAIIKTLKVNDPGCYAGILMAHWQFPDGMNEAAADGKAAGEMVKHFLKPPYQGDFMGIEKNGTAAGVRLFGDAFYWNDTKNAEYLAWCKSLGQTVDLPLFGWQISLGYKDEPGYPALPNANYQWEDTYFQYFFKHPKDFIDAGFIGFDAGSNDRGIGTCASLKAGSGDNGYFYAELKKFKEAGPWLKTGTAAEKTFTPARQTVKLSQIGTEIRCELSQPVNGKYQILTLQGRELAGGSIEGKELRIPAENFAAGVHLLRITGSSGESLSRTIVLSQQ